MAPDWSADWLHKEAIYILNRLALQHDSVSFDELSDERKAYLKVVPSERVEEEYL